ncbi:MAG: DNA-binding domain-containing protein [Rectinemataceae bacterium]
MAVTIRAMRNNLGTSESPYYALASWSRVVESQAFMDRMAAGRTTLSMTDIIAVFQLAREELGRLLAEGCYVKTPLGAALPVARGRFNSSGDPFLPKNPDSGHELRIDFRLDPAIEKKALAAIRCVRDREGDRRSPWLRSASALPSGSEVEAGGLLRISGRRMKFDPSNEDLGLFFGDEAGRLTRAKAYVQVLPSSLIAGVPAALAEGSYALILRTISKGGETLEGLAMERLLIRKPPLRPPA